MRIKIVFSPVDNKFCLQMSFKLNTLTLSLSNCPLICFCKVSELNFVHRVYLASTTLQKDLSLIIVLKVRIYCVTIINYNRKEVALRLYEFMLFGAHPTNHKTWGIIINMKYMLHMGINFVQFIIRYIFTIIFSHITNNLKECFTNYK